MILLITIIFILSVSLSEYFRFLEKRFMDGQDILFLPYNKLWHGFKGLYQACFFVLVGYSSNYKYALLGAVLFWITHDIFTNLGLSIGEGIKQTIGGSRIFNFGYYPVEYTGQNQNPTFFDFDDILYNFGSGNSDSNRRSVFTIWKNGKIKINQKNHNNTSNHLFADINPTTVLDIDGDRGIRIPRLTAAQIALIPSPEDGEEVYCTDCLGSNGSAGAKQHYQASTSSWRTFTTF